LLEDLKSTIEHKNYYDKQNKLHEHMFEKYKFEENEKLLEREEKNRE